MKLSVNGLDFIDAVGRVSKAISSKNLLQILEGIKLSANRDRLTLTGSDSDLSIEKTIKADVISDGETVVPGKFLYEYIRHMTDGTIELDLNEDTRILSIRYQDASSTIKCLNAGEYPTIKRLEETENFCVGSKDFKDLIAKIIFCVATDDSRPILKGCCIEAKDGILCGVALDGFRLAKCQKKLVSSSSDLKMVVPARTLQEISKMLNDTDESVSVKRLRNFISLELDNTRITAKLLDGEFINYNQIISTNFDTFVLVNRTQILQSLERANLLARSEKNNLIRIAIADNVAHISSNSEMGNIDELIVVKCDGKDITIAFNARFLLDCVNGASDEFIKIKLYRPENPVIITDAEDSGEYLYFILPIRMR